MLFTKLTVEISTILYHLEIQSVREERTLPEPVPSRRLVVDRADVAVVEVGHPRRLDGVGRQRSPSLGEHPVEVEII